MNGYFYVVNTLKNYLKATPFVNTVTIGDIFAVDLTKQTIFPLNHMIVNNVTLGEVTISMNISILFMDLVDDSKEEIVDLWEGNDNEQDVLNTTLSQAQRLSADLMRGSLYSSQVMILNEPTAEPFTDRFENKIAGWTLTFDVIVPNEMSIC
jgi:ABC-type phosphate transport system ATPase subunit